MKKFIFNPPSNKKNVILRQGSVIDEFHFQKGYAPEGHHDCVAQTDPLIMMFNQQRLSALGPTAIQSWLDTLKEQKHDPLEQLRAKCSDDDLIQLVKPRHLQSLSDLKAWSDYMASNMQTFSEELKALRKAQQDKADADEVTKKVEHERKLFSEFLAKQTSSSTVESK